METRLLLGSVVLVASLAVAAPAQSQKVYAPGVDDVAIKLGQTVPLSGPASSFSSYARVMTGFFQRLNEQGGVNGRKVDFILLDNAYTPSKAIEQTRRLVEQDEILAEVGTLGTLPNVATQRYMNEKKVPQIFISAGGRRFNDPKTSPWTVPLYPGFEMEGAILAKYVLRDKPGARIGVLYQNDDFGKDFLKGLRARLGDKVSQIVAEVSHEFGDPSVDMQILKLKASGADTLMLFTTPKFAAQAIRKTFEIGWRPLQIIGGPSNSIDGVLKPAGFEASTGVITTQFLKQASDPAWADDPEVAEFKTFMSKYAPNDNVSDFIAVTGYVSANAIAIALRKAGDNLTRENLLKQATSFTNVRPPLLLPGITINNSPDDYSAYKAMRIARFDGRNWALVGDAISAD
jgi:ABC-type branched-subunit amino acid transport system substrate-binding protein